MSRTVDNNAHTPRGYWRNPRSSFGKLRNRIARHRAKQDLGKGVEPDLGRHTTRHRHSARWDAY